MNQDLFKKYDVPAPRYTSYPTVPYWAETPSKDQWISHLNSTLENNETSWSCYLHLPFCETLCTFCGCNTIITKDHSKESPYVDLLISEWKNYLKLVPALGQKPMKHIHLGGGTPTFLSHLELKRLIEGLFKDMKLGKDFEGSIEVDPRRTNAEQLKVLFDLGFRRVSMGVQDFNPEVQRLVNRIQPFEITQELTESARSLGYTSVNYDLIYGLAKQTRESFIETTKLTVSLRPDRIALYSFALVPWIKPAQRLFKDEDLPKASEKRELYEVARTILLDAGYIEIGMDHFSLPHDGLALALKAKSLHRNFMGYSDIRTDVLLGLGLSSISETPFSFHQNEKLLPKYTELVNKNEVPTLRGHLLTRDDQVAREQILKFMTTGEVQFLSESQRKEAQVFLKEMLNDKLIEISGDTLKVKDEGRAFLRNACVFFDERLKKDKPQTQVFSQAI